MTERDRIREDRKIKILDGFPKDKKVFTNEVATKIGVHWPVADSLLRALVAEGKLAGGKDNGYILPVKPTILERIKSVLHV